MLLCNIDDEGSAKGLAGLYLYIGLQNGVLMRSAMDDLTGALSDTRMRFLGTKGVRLSAIKIGGSRTKNALMGTSSKSWIAYLWRNRHRLVPVSYDPLDFVTSFHSELLPHGLVGISGNTLRIISFDKLGEEFNVSSFPLKYTPKRFVVHPTAFNFITIESEYRLACPSQRTTV